MPGGSRLYKPTPRSKIMMEIQYITGGTQSVGTGYILLRVLGDQATIFSIITFYMYFCYNQYIRSDHQEVD